MKRKYLYSDNANEKKLVLATLINQVGGGTKASVLQWNS